MGEHADQNNFEYGHFSRCDIIFHLKQYQKIRNEVVKLDKLESETIVTRKTLSKKISFKIKGR